VSRAEFHTFVILGAMRTGSNFLERTLAQHPKISCHGELFNPDFFGSKDRAEAFGLSLADREADPRRVLAAIRSNDAGIAGFRLFDGHDVRAVDAVLADRAVAKIILHRPALDSFISLRIAQKTDQWILGNARSRKAAKIRFDAGQFERYRERQQAFFSDVARRLQITGQGAFHIGFDQLSDMAVLNGLLGYLGLEGELERPDGTLKPQNPGGYGEKVENPDALAPYRDDPVRPAAPRAPQLKRFVTSDKPRLMFAPIAGNDAEPVVDWMAGRDGHSQASLKAWQDADPGFASFSVVGHPVARAYRVFFTRIATKGAEGYPKIRRRLERFHGVVLPQGPEPVAWRQGFLAFLAFLERNLAGQTGIRIDDDWAHQSDLIAAISEQQPISRIVREDELGEWVSAVTDGNGFSPAPELPDVAALEDVYTDEIERLCRKIYRKDYRKFGFSGWASGRN